MATHLNREILEAYARKALPAADLLAASRHLAGCRECAALVRAHTGGAGVPSLAADDDDSHLSYEQIEAYLDGRLPAAARAEADAHLGLCRHCAGDLAELRAFASQMQAPPARSARWREKLANWWRMPHLAMAASAAAVTLVLATSFLVVHILGKHQVPEVAAVRAQRPSTGSAIPPDLLPGSASLPERHLDAIVEVLRGESQTTTPVLPDNDAIEQARQKDPNAHLLLGALYQQRGMWVEAEREYRLLLKANPNSKEARKLWENAWEHSKPMRK
jgi:hypothetical protein